MEMKPAVIVRQAFLKSCRNYLLNIPQDKSGANPLYSAVPDNTII